MTHVTGYVNGIELPFFTDTKVLLMESWVVSRAVELIETHHATTCVSATLFYASWWTPAVIRVRICRASGCSPAAVRRCPLPDL